MKIEIKDKLVIEGELKRTLNVTVQALENTINTPKRGRKPSKRNIDTKAYNRLSVSVNNKEKEKIQAYADREFEGNISLLIRTLLKNKKII